MAARLRLLALVGVMAVLAGCANNSGDNGAGPPLSTGSPARTAPSPTSTPTEADAPGAIPQECGDVLPFTAVVRALAVPLDGGTSRIYATDFHPDSGRLARLTCGYGVGDTEEGAEPRPPQVEFSLSGYLDSASAAARLEDTVSSARGGGQQVEALAIGGYQGYLLNDPEDITYVVAADEITLVVTLLHGVVPEPAERVVLLDIVATALNVPTPTTTS